ncbi:MAG TPA: ATP-binding cassette domain-containing protein [Candidatus Poseidoniales archaeon]|nr:MAG TPA: ATP-binding cassette domain-containing protein [Candidatus Poseidoniales archaeon]HII25326.1 ATP-binding cassette domain-containing protein [Candidatus Poseidoniaceae archaeon]|tara:strand:+ start:1053 stop:1784 length:732 start_codon:yes stop_codon:yes gene_type:complete
MSLIVQDLDVSFGPNTVISNLNFEMKSGDIVAIIGPSGCGKTTLLRAISGLLKPTRGTIVLDGKNIEKQPCEQREVGMLFQRPVLFPFKDVLGNILFAYKRKKDADMDQVNAILGELGLTGKENQAIETLSGGEAQRVVLARALLTHPRLMLLDEPLSALDVDLRRKIAHEIRSILKARGIPAIHVTHDPAEAAIIGDRVLHWKDLQSSDDSVDEHSQSNTQIMGEPTSAPPNSITEQDTNDD